ncbi:hypothetical protein ACFSTA_15535 [Ornithinibacillus salinisoli]|uniref:Carboxypeptidase regulatory-like domain-containing protein n=1 Tax=Ornithinibacillus salinisoli TaxID=1848459 RepID=A0ABW4W2K8_9BACI
MKIKIKVKHLVLVIAVCFLSIPFMTSFIVPQIELYVADKKLEDGKSGGKALMMDALEGPLLPGQKWDKIIKYIVGSGVAGGYDIYVGPSMTTHSGHAITEANFTWEEKLPYLYDYLDNGPVDGYLGSVAKELASYYQRERQLNKADEVLLKAINRFSATRYSSHQDELLLERVKIAINESKLEKAKKYIQELIQTIDPENYYKNAEIAKLRAEIIIRQGNLKKAYKEIKTALNKYEDDWEKENTRLTEEIEGDTEEINIENTVIYQQLQSLEWHLSKAIENGDESIVTVNGKVVRNDGTPLKNAGVFLRKESAVNSSITEDEPYPVITDENGNFEISGVIPGSYQIFLGFMFEQIDGWTWPINSNEWIEVDGSEDIQYNITLHPLMDIYSPVNQEKIADKEVTFTWEEIDGAAYYNINLGVGIESGSVGASFKTEIKDTQLTVPIERLYDKQIGLLIGDEDIVDPYPLLGFTNPNNRFSWSVEAYNVNHELITRSNGYRLNGDTIGNLPFFHLHKRQLTNADRLLIEKKEKEALVAYKKNYEENPDDIHSLRMIVRMIGMEGDGSLETRNQLALPYLIELAEKSSSPEYSYEVVNYYYEKEDWKAYHKWYERYAELNDGVVSEYIQGTFASALMKQEKLEESRELFQEVMQKDESNYFVGNWLAVEIYLSEDFNKAIEIAKEHPDKTYLGHGETRKDWLTLVKKLQEESVPFTNYEQELKNVLELYFKSNEEELTQWIEATDKQALKKFIKAIREI